jgi:primosomal protein N' (replication factor Y)
VAGRAGRGERPGRVFVQTLNPDNEAILAAASHDFERFATVALQERREARYPPFVRLVNIVCQGPERPSVSAHAERVSQRLRQALPAATVLGPVDCPIERLNSQWRRHIVIKMEPGADPAPIQSALSGLNPANVRTVIDVDPSSLL